MQGTGVFTAIRKGPRRTIMQPTENGASRTTDDLAGELAAMRQELGAVKGELEGLLRAKCSVMHRTLVHLCCPKEWFEDEIDDDEVLSQMIEVPSFEEWAKTLAAKA
jgi:hypothetical protein